VSFLELARAAELRLWGSARKERKEDFPPLYEAEAREPHTNPPREESGRSEKSPSRWRPTYAHPWPDALPGLGRRIIGPFDACSTCSTWSWVRYGGVVLCLPCATAVADLEAGKS
jgi:hypothetical protein